MADAPPGYRKIPLRQVLSSEICAWAGCADDAAIGKYCRRHDDLFNLLSDDAQQKLDARVDERRQGMGAIAGNMKQCPFPLCVTEIKSTAKACVPHYPLLYTAKRARRDEPASAEDVQREIQEGLWDGASSLKTVSRAGFDMSVKRRREALKGTGEPRVIDKTVQGPSREALGSGLSARIQNDDPRPNERQRFSKNVVQTMVKLNELLGKMEETENELDAVIDEWNDEVDNLKIVR